MAPATRGLIVPLLGTLLLSAPAPVAKASGAGGVSGDPAESGANPSAGGAEYGAALRSLPGRPRVRSVRLADARVVAGGRARLIVRVSRPAASSVRLRIVVAGRRDRSRTLDLGRVRTGRDVTVRLPSRLRLRPGAYTLRVLALGGAGEPAARGEAVRLVVRAKRRATRRPAPAPAPALPLVPPALGGTPGVFPVQGPYSFGGADSRFGAPRTGHTHEGQDVSAAEGLPVVAPLAGEVLFNDYQRGGAGRYVVLHADDGRDMFFAHCQAGSAGARVGERVAAGARLCSVGSTGGSSGPHLHFEIWPGGWRHLEGTRPIDPLPQLRAWAG